MKTFGALCLIALMTVSAFAAGPVYNPAAPGHPVYNPTAAGHPVYNPAAQGNPQLIPGTVNGRPHNPAVDRNACPTGLSQARYLVQPPFNNDANLGRR